MRPTVADVILVNIAASRVSLRPVVHAMPAISAPEDKCLRVPRDKFVPRVITVQPAARRPSTAHPDIHVGKELVNPPHAQQAVFNPKKVL